MSGIGPALGTSDVDDTNVVIKNDTNTDFSGTLSFGALATGSYSYIQINLLVVNSTNSGNVQLQWAQNASNGTATTVYTHSHGVAQKQA